MTDRRRRRRTSPRRSALSSVVAPLVVVLVTLVSGCFPETDLDRVEANFARYQELWAGNQATTGAPAVAALYSADAKIVTRIETAAGSRELVVTGEELKAGFTERMREMRESRDRNEYRDVKTRHVGSKFRIYGRRRDARRSDETPFVVEFMKSADGTWLIVVDHTTIHD